MIHKLKILPEFFPLVEKGKRDLNCVRMIVIIRKTTFYYCRNILTENIPVANA